MPLNSRVPARRRRRSEKTTARPVVQASVPEQFRTLGVRIDGGPRIVGYVPT